MGEQVTLAVEAVGRPSSTDLEEEERSLDRRLSRIEGQVRGLRRMLAENRDCREVAIQFAAVSRALNKAALSYLVAHLIYCVENPGEAGEAGYTVNEVRELLGHLR
jgi:DNA-binding FrmR family transcriptional regulator